MRKKLFASLLCAVLAAALTAGCGSKSEPDETATSDRTTTASPADTKETSGTKTTSGRDEGVTASAVEQRTVYVTPDWVQSVIDKNQTGCEDYIIAEAGYGDVRDCESYNNGHLPGAQYVDICEVEDADGEPGAAYNLLAPDVVEKNLLSHGITKDTKVILYGEDICGVARVAYAYIWAGVEDVKVLNGGLEAWTTAGYKTETEAGSPTAASDFGTKVPAHPEYWISTEDVRAKLENDSNFKAVSIRSEEEWIGQTSGYNYMDKAGEPEGAVWGKGAETAFDVAQFVNSDGTVKNLDGFKEVWKDCDFTLDNELAFYCGTGWRACVPFLVLYENGYDNISVFDGGWYEWLMHEDYPVQFGNPSGGSVEHTTVGQLPTDRAAEY